MSTTKFTKLEFQSMLANAQNTQSNPGKVISSWLFSKNLRLYYVTGFRNVGIIRVLQDKMCEPQYMLLIGMVVDLNNHVMRILRYPMSYSTDINNNSQIASSKPMLPLSTIVTAYAVQSDVNQSMSWKLADQKNWGLNNKLRCNDESSIRWDSILDMVQDEQELDINFNYHYAVVDPSVNPFVDGDSVKVILIGTTDMLGRFSIASGDLGFSYTDGVVNESVNFARVHENGYLINTTTSGEFIKVFNNGVTDALKSTNKLGYMRMLALISMKNPDIGAITARDRTMLEIARTDSGFNHSQTMAKCNIALLDNIA